MMTRRGFATTLAFVVAGTVATLAADVSYDMDRTVALSQYNRFAWQTGTPIGDPLNDARITAAIERQLATRGLTRTDDAVRPQLFVRYHVGFDRAVRVNGSSTGWGPYGDGPGRSGSARAETVLVGTLAVEIVEASTGRIAWRGYTSIDVDPRATPEKRERTVEKTVARLLKSVPRVR
jgi:hypothetical protein